MRQFKNSNRHIKNNNNRKRLNFGIPIESSMCSFLHSLSLELLLECEKIQIESNVKSKSKRSNKGNGRSSHITMSYDLIFMHFFTLKNE